jgi:transcriptional regulator with XRE-family HTH domain
MVHVPNDRLRAAIHAKGLTVEDLSVRVGVDPKTVERWIGDDSRRPHRKSRVRLAQVLRVEEAHLWPDLASDIRAVPNGDSELVHVYPSRSSVPFDVWCDLLNSVEHSMDIVVFSGVFLVEQLNALPIVKAKANEGIRFRLAVGDETSPAVIQRAAEEGTTGGLEGRVQMMRRYLRGVADVPGVEVRTHGTTLYNSIYRFDDQMLVNGHAFGSLAGQSPVMHLRLTSEEGMWQHYMSSIERVWEVAVPEIY